MPIVSSIIDTFNKAAFLNFCWRIPQENYAWILVQMQSGRTHVAESK